MRLDGRLSLSFCGVWSVTRISSSVEGSCDIEDNYTRCTPARRQYAVCSLQFAGSGYRPRPQAHRRMQPANFAILVDIVVDARSRRIKVERPFENRRQMK